MIIKLPYRFTLREYQHALFNAMFNEGMKRLVTVWHRRAGKDKTYINLIVAAAFVRKGTYCYLFPTLKQAREVIWEGMDKNGFAFLDHIPKHLIKRKNATNMLIELVNGSKIRIGGSDKYNNLMGSNPIGIVFSEFSLQNPLAWHYLRPILVENGGWAAFNFTPRGQNHGYQLYNQAQTNDKWFCELLTVNDTKDENGNPIMSEEMIAEEKLAGMSESLIEQEFYCSFTASLPGAYYMRELQQCEKEKRILDFSIESSFPVYTYWDLGYRDSTSIWFVQKINNEIRLVNYYENNMQGLQHYANYIQEWAAKNNITYAQHWAPHDIKVHDLSTGNSRWETMRNLGIKFNIVPRLQGAQGDVIEGIFAVRTLFSRFYFHKTNCALGLNALRSYHCEFDAKNNIFHDKPKHDWSSHASDAFRYMAVAMKEDKPTFSQRTMKRW